MRKKENMIHPHHFQNLLENLTARTSIRQAVMAVESGDQSLRWRGASGDGIQADSPFFIASIDKLLNAVLVMLLVEQGRVALDDPIAKHLPGPLTRKLHVLNGTDHTGQITIRHLLAHASGLADWLEDSPKNGKSLIEHILSEGDRSFSLEEITEIVRSRLRPHFPPQDLTARKPKVRYSDTNYMLLMALIENVHNQPLQRVHEELLYQPLGMQHTSMPGLSEPTAPTLPPVPLRADGQVIHIPELMKSFRGIHSTSGDLIAFLRALLDQQIFSQEETLAAMQADWQRFGFPLDRAALRSPGWPIEYGLGLMRFQLPRIFTALRQLPAVIGHSGSTGCWLFWCPELDLYMCGTVNEASAGALPYRVLPQLIASVIA